jgi:alpha-tubulin suppressor-like RCC1 family protein
MKSIPKVIPTGFVLMSMLTLVHGQAALTVTQVAASELQAMFIVSDGSLWGMGYNGDGELGLGPTNYIEIPAMVVSNGVVAVSLGERHSAFLMSDGSLWMAGDNEYGQLGDGTTNSRLTFEKVIPANVKSVSCGGGHTLFTTTVVTGVFPHQTITQNLYGMGLNRNGQLGDAPRTTALPRT